MSETTGNLRGVLKLAANAIGMTDDVPARSLAALRDGDLLIFEEAKEARKALKAAGVHRDFLLFSEHKQSETIADLEACLKAGQTAVYMSDQGAPGFADPGRELAEVAYRVNARVEVIPGPSSLTAAISACPFDLNRFTYGGFPPREPEVRGPWLSDMLSRPEALILLDTPYRRDALLSALAEVAPTRKVFIALDIAGEHERFVAGSAKSLKTIAPDQKLNFVLIVEGQKEKESVKAGRAQPKRRP